MSKIAIIGAGVTGLSLANCLGGRHHVKVFESKSRAGGLISCERIDGNLYHTVGGHVFNSKRSDVLEWFWGFFDKDADFVSATRNAVVYIGKPIPYPIENHLYQLDELQVKAILRELLTLARGEQHAEDNFESFLRGRFGETLYQLYFKPYNEKIWRRPLNEIPLAWLEGKLPMPTIEDMVLTNIVRKEERAMVHSTFYYPKRDGSQFIVDTLARGLDIEYNADTSKIYNSSHGWNIAGQIFEQVVFTGNLQDLPLLIGDQVDLAEFIEPIETLTYHGTTTALCEIENTPYSWIYLPDPSLPAHRIICTGNFSSSNNGGAENTATVEFTGAIDRGGIEKAIAMLPFKLKYIAHRQTLCTYPIQNPSTRTLVKNLKSKLAERNFFLVGRFAEWEYYNMDAAIGASIDLAAKL